MSLRPSTELDTPVEAPRSTWLDSLVLGLLALLVAGPGLGTPTTFVFDEIFYVSDAYSHLEVGIGRGFQAHPPLGTWLVAAGTALTASPVGWRLASLGLGVVTVVALHRLALHVLPPTRAGRLLALTPSILLMTDGSWLVLSRTAMLDGPMTAFIVVTVAATLAAVSGERGDAPDRRWIVVAGMAAGAATSVKWSGALALVLLMVVLLLQHPGRPVRDRLRAVVPTTVAATAIALLVYSASWLPFAVHRGEVPVGDCPNVAVPCVEEGGVAGVLAQHVMLVRYHTRLQSDAAIASPPSLWPLMRSPIGFYRPNCHTQSEPVELPTAFDAPGACDEETPDGADTIAFYGNVVVWFGFAALLPVLATSARRRHSAAQVALAGWALQWLPWLFATRVSYLWYMAPVVPFMALGLTAVAVALPRSAVVRTYTYATLGALAGGLAVLATPVDAAAILIGWTAGGWVAGRVRDASRLPAANTSAALVIAAMLTSAAVVAAVVNRGAWTAG